MCIPYIVDGSMKVMVREKDEGFVRIRIRESDHARITKRVTYDKKIYDIVTGAVDALEEKEENAGNRSSRERHR